MPFNPNEPQNGEVVDADVLRDQFNAIHDEAIAPETDPVFAASEAAKLGAGDKAKLDTALQPATGLKLDQAAPQTLTGGAPVFHAGLQVGPVAENKLTPTGEYSVALYALDELHLGGNNTYLKVSVEGLAMRCNPGGTITVNDAPVLTQEADPVFGASEAALFVPGDKAKLDSALQPGTDASAIAYTPANPGYWNSPAPTTIAEAIERLAAALSNNGANPI